MLGLMGWWSLRVLVVSRAVAEVGMGVLVVRKVVAKVGRVLVAAEVAVRRVGSSGLHVIGKEGNHDKPKEMLQAHDVFAVVQSAEVFFTNLNACCPTLVQHNTMTQLILTLSAARSDLVLAEGRLLAQTITGSPRGTQDRNQRPSSSVPLGEFPSHSSSSFSSSLVKSVGKKGAEGDEGDEGERGEGEEKEGKKEMEEEGTNKGTKRKREEELQ
jgi:hypothetical protein